MHRWRRSASGEGKPARRTVAAWLAILLCVAGAATSLSSAQADAAAPSAGELPIARVGSYYRVALAVSQGASSRCSVTDGTLPAGLSLDPGRCVVSGTPTGVSESDVTIRLTGPVRDTKVTFSLAVLAAAPVSGGGLQLADGSVGVEYDARLPLHAASRSLCGISSGALPAGLSLDPESCRVSGVPTTSGRYDATVAIAGPAGLTSASLRIEIR